MPKQWDRLWIGGHAATMVPGGGADRAPYGAIEDAAIAARDGRLAYVGRRGDLPGPPETLAAEVIDLNGAWVLPGLIDCHTHLVYAGSRAREFEMRLQGATYQEVAQAGGGIVSTVRETRAADEARLIAESRPRLDALMAEGVTTVEIKSGYGLETAAELRQLRAARALGASHGGVGQSGVGQSGVGQSGAELARAGRAVSVRTTFLGAHAIPPESAGDADGYIDRVVGEMLPAVVAEGLADAVDGFTETIAFTPDQMRRVFDAAQAHGLPVKLHAEQLSDMKGAVMAAGYGALSVDHVEYLGQDGVDAIAASGTVAVLLPGAFYTLREAQMPPITALRAAGVPMALSTDCNPGSSPTTSLLLMVNMGCTLFRLTPEEALAGVTRVAARALGLSDRGMLAEGLRADLAVYAIAHPAELAYRFGTNPCVGRVVAGVAA